MSKAESEIQVLALSHLELFTLDVKRMEQFYTDVLGFRVTDRGAGSNAMVFLSRNPNEHHQLVLNPANPEAAYASPVDHISFRAGSLPSLRSFADSLARAAVPVQSVSHGNTWSIYFRDPEDNRIELFVDTPWHVSQPCRFEVDLSLSDQALFAFTESRIRDLPGFAPRSDFRKEDC